MTEDDLKAIEARCNAATEGFEEYPRTGLYVKDQKALQQDNFDLIAAYREQVKRIAELDKDLAQCRYQRDGGGLSDGETL